jgi:DNA-binding MarR family transcriptional regulator
MEPTGPRARRDPIELAIENWTAQGWAEATPGMAMVTSVMRVQQLLLQQVERVLRPMGLTFARFEVLMLLSFSRTGALPVGKVGERLQVHPASVTNAVDRLEDDGLVERIPNPQDGRSVLARITDRGRRLVAEAADELNRDVFTKVPVPAADLDALFAVLRDLRRAFGDFT